MNKKIKERIVYLEQQIAAGNRLDGWSLKGVKKELKELKKIKNKTTTIPFDKLNGI
tara:strand:+ start:391 stop:558 length:168 start_codon:yes stop_codon:yes gene_type:complete